MYQQDDDFYVKGYNNQNHVTLIQLIKSLVLLLHVCDDWLTTEWHDGGGGIEINCVPFQNEIFIRSGSLNIMQHSGNFHFGLYPYPYS